MYVPITYNLHCVFSIFCAKIKEHIRNAIEEERRLGTESLRDGKPIGVEEGAFLICMYAT